MLDSKNKFHQEIKECAINCDLATKTKFESKDILLYSCSLIQKESERIHYLKIFDNFLLYSKDPLYKKFRILNYDSSFLACFKYTKNTDKITNISNKKNIESFKLIPNKSKEFCSRESKDLIEIYKILKKKLNLSGFHEVFKLIKQINYADFTSLYLGYNNYENEFYTIKVLTKETLATKKNGVELLKNEINILRNIDFLKIIRLDCVYETDSSYYLVFEFLKGESLSTLIKEKVFFKETHARRIIYHIIDTLNYLHRKNIMHRDIRPENILLRNYKENSDFNIVLCEFSLSCFNTLPYLIARCGSFGYAAPEIMNLNNNSSFYSLKCDLYSVGITLFEMLVGSLPYKQENLGTNNPMVEFQKFEKFNELSENAKDLILKLTCEEKSRLSANDALNHDFFKEIKIYKFSQSDEENMSLSQNMEEFKKRKISLEEKNILITSPGSSPYLEKKEGNNQN